MSCARAIQKPTKIWTKKQQKTVLFVILNKAKKFLIRNAKLSCQLSEGRCQFRWCVAYPSCKSLICRQGTRPRPAGDTGSVSWRSGQNCAKWITSKQFWVPQVEGGTAQRWVVLFKLQVANCKWQISERYALDYTSDKLQVANGKFRNCVGDYRLSRKLKT